MLYIASFAVSFGPVLWVMLALTLVTAVQRFVKNVSATAQGEIEKVLRNEETQAAISSFGFGGTNACLIFKRYED